MRIDVHHHADRDTQQTLCEILRKVDLIMARLEELNAELVQINDTTNELADDVQDLVSRLDQGGLTDAETTEIKDKLVALKSQLQAVASKHTPGSAPA